MDSFLLLTILVIFVSGYVYYRNWIQLPNAQRGKVFETLPQAPSKKLSDFKGDADQYMDYLIGHGLSPTEITSRASLPLKHVYEAIRQLAEKDRVEILFLKETPQKNYFNVGQGRVAMTPYVFRKGLPSNLTPDKQEMLALLDLEFSKS